jgi:hypothetical protein
MDEWIKGVTHFNVNSLKSSARIISYSLGPCSPYNRPYTYTLLFRQEYQVALFQYHHEKTGFCNLAA